MSRKPSVASHLVRPLPQCGKHTLRTVLEGLGLAWLLGFVADGLSFETGSHYTATLIWDWQSPASAPVSGPGNALSQAGRLRQHERQHPLRREGACALERLRSFTSTYFTPRHGSREGGYSFLAGSSLLPAEATSTRETLLFPGGGAGDDVGELCSRVVALRG